MHNFKELKVWQLSRRLVKEVYETTVSFDVNFISQVQLEELSIKISEIQKMIFGLIKTLRQESYV